LDWQRAIVFCLALVLGVLFVGPPTGEATFLPVFQPDLPAVDGAVPDSPTDEEPPVDPAKVIYLTFDDGPSKNTAIILDTLQKYGVKATFFVNGRDNEFARGMYRRIVGEGHVIGNHTYSHNYSYVYASIDNYVADTEKLTDLLVAVTGVRPELIRFPGGSNNQVSWRYGGKQLMPELVREMTARGYSYFDWNAGGMDAGKKPVSRAEIVKTVLRQISHRHETIILLHDSAIQTTTAAALPEIIETLLAEGYVFRVLTRDAYSAHFIDAAASRAEAGN